MLSQSYAAEVRYIKISFKWNGNKAYFYAIKCCPYTFFEHYMSLFFNLPESIFNVLMKNVIVGKSLPKVLCTFKIL